MASEDLIVTGPDEWVWTFRDDDGTATGPHGPWTRAGARAAGPPGTARELRPATSGRWSLTVSQGDRPGGGVETFRPAQSVIEMLPEPARWRAWVLTDPEGWQIRLTSPPPGAEALLEAMGPGAFVGAMQGVGGPHMSAIVEFQRPGEPPRCWVWDAEQTGLTLPYRDGDFLMVSYLAVGDGAAEHAIVSSLEDLGSIVEDYREGGERRREPRADQD